LLIDAARAQVFTRFDRDGDGLIDEGEMRDALREAVGLDAAAAASLFRRYGPRRALRT
jgi:Ca2+-binding EF-hand superfamily protein